MQLKDLPRGSKGPHLGKRKRRTLLATAGLGLGLAALAQPPAPGAAVELSNVTPITFANPNIASLATPSPSDIDVTAMSTVVIDVNVTLHNVSHSYADDLDIELVGPNGAVVPLMSDSCGNSFIADRTLTFDDDAASFLPDGPGSVCNTDSTWKPSNAPDLGSPPGPEEWLLEPTATTLAAFNGINPNGKWSLSVGDDFAVSTGKIMGGWSIRITTAATAPITMSGDGNGKAASPYPVAITVGGQPGLISDVNLTIPGLAHPSPQGLRVALQSPSGTTVKILSLDCGDQDVVNKDFTFDDQAMTTPPLDCAGGGTFKPTAKDLSPMIAPAPSGPYGTSLGAFNGQDPNGQWKLFIEDRGTNDSGWISAMPTLTFKTTDAVAPETSFTRKPKTGARTTRTLKFVSSEAGSRFECKLDKAKTFKSCASPLKLRHLAPGKHEIQVRAVDPVGNTDPTPLRGRWRVTRT